MLESPRSAAINALDANACACHTGCSVCRANHFVSGAATANPALFTMEFRDATVPRRHLAWRKWPPRKTGEVLWQTMIERLPMVLSR